MKFLLTKIVGYFSSKMINVEKVIRALRQRVEISSAVLTVRALSENCTCVTTYVGVLYRTVQYFSHSALDGEQHSRHKQAVYSIWSVTMPDCLSPSHRTTKTLQSSVPST
jgi:hypothetical protein